MIIKTNLKKIGFSSFLGYREPIVNCAFSFFQDTSHDVEILNSLMWLFARRGNRPWYTDGIYIKCHWKPVTVLNFWESHLQLFFRTHSCFYFVNKISSHKLCSTKNIPGVQFLASIARANCLTDKNGRISNAFSIFTSKFWLLASILFLMSG